MVASDDDDIDQDEESIHEPFKNGTFTDGEIKVSLKFQKSTVGSSLFSTFKWKISNTTNFRIFFLLFSKLASQN